MVNVEIPDTLALELDRMAEAEQSSELLTSRSFSGRTSNATGNYRRFAFRLELGIMRIIRNWLKVLRPMSKQFARNVTNASRISSA